MKKEKKYSITEKVWIYQGDMAWHFISLDKGLSTSIRKNYSGMVKVKVVIGITSWNTSLFWSKHEQSYIIPIKKKVRFDEGILSGDTIKATFCIL